MQTEISEHYKDVMPVIQQISSYFSFAVDPDDMSQDGIVLLLEKIDQYDPEIGCIQPWFREVFRNYVIGQCRRKMVGKQKIKFLEYLKRTENMNGLKNKIRDMILEVFPHLTCLEKKYLECMIESSWTGNEIAFKHIDFCVQINWRKSKEIRENLRRKMLTHGQKIGMM